MNKIIKTIPKIILFSCFFLTIFTNAKLVYADGAIIETGTSGGGSTSNTTSGGNSDCSGDAGKFRVDCTGTSWIFYKSVVSAKNAKTVTFTPINDSKKDASGNNVTINKQCAEHKDQEGGFWHFGRNAQAFSYDGFADYDYLLVAGSNQTCASYDKNNNCTKKVNYGYLSKSGKWGHMSTYDMGWLPDKRKKGWSWGGKAKDGSGYYAPTSIKHDLYYDGTKIYEATKAATDPTKHSTSAVLKDWEKACAYSNNKNGTSFNCSSIPNNVVYFCYWNDMEEKKAKLILTPILTDGTAFPSAGTVTKEATISSGNSKVNIETKANDAPTGYHYEGIKETETAKNYLTTNQNREYSENVGAGETKRFAVYSKITFEGKANVSGGNANVTTGWQDTDETVSTEIDCPVSVGETCQATFKLYLRSRNAEGSTTYNVYRSDNGGKYTKQNPIELNATNVPTSGNKVFEKTVDIAPGQEICYKIKFDTKNNGKKDESACIKAKPSTFKGKTNLYLKNTTTGAITKTTDWKNSGNTTENYFFNCENEAGCRISFNHQMKRTAGTGSSNWIVARTSNLTSKVSETTVGSGNFSPSSDDTSVTVKTDNNLTLYPGMVVCETLTFYPNNTSSTTASTKVCAFAEGDAQQYFGVALLNIKVSKDNGTNWYNEVYVKPGDQIKYRSVYQPKLQYAYNIASVRSELSNWKNAYTIGDIISLDYSYTNGSIDSHTNITPSSKTIQFSHVGTSLDEIVNTNKKAGIKNTPTKITFTQSGDSLAATVLAENKNWGTASARVPHNFINTTKIADETEEDRTAYAGEEKTVNLNIYTSKKQNSETDGYYATPSKDAKKRLKICFTAFSTYKCYYTNVEDAGKNGVLNENGLSTSSSNDSVTSEEKYKFTAPDLPAGTKIYIYSQVFPKDSGADTNYQYPTGGYDINNENHWATSDVAEYIIAKRPNLQILGGNVYSNGKIETSTSIKNCLAGVNCLRNSNNYNPNGYDDNYVFGSWGELGVISGGSVIGLASGATLGYQNLFSGYKYYTSCGRIPLTFANSNPSGSACLTPAAGALGNSSSNNSMTKIKDDIISKYVDKTVKTDSVPGGTIDIDTTTVYYSDDVLKIEGDLVYENTSYSSFANLPKLIIVAENEIGIGCSVNRIDGILIAKKVTTCTEVTNKKDIETKRENSNQLIINGAVITSELVANRTYGAATGENSSTPAEIINFDPSLYRWESGSSTAEATTNASTFLITTYQKELAPRY